GRFGYRTSVAVQEFQNYAKLTMDGIIGSNTWDRIISELATLSVVTNIPVFSSSYYLTIGSTGIDVFKMQEYLNAIAATNTCLKPIRVDGAYGNAMATMVRQYQYLKDISIDGAIGRTTWDTIVNEYIKL
ncbi:MAG: peptidoglycan-binding protein, partial [Erysipelotrichales bacterium]